MITAFEPIWILTAIGYLACRLGLLGAEAASVLSRFTFYLAMPAALFLTLAKTPLSGFAVRPLIAFGVSTALVMTTAWLAAGRLFGRKAGEQTIAAMTGSYVNSANLGIPIALRVLGSVSFLVEVVLLQVLVVTPMILISLDRHSDAAGRIRLRRILTLPVRNPVICGSALGVIASAAGFHPAPVVRTPLALLASAAVPAALIALGASLHDKASSTGPTRAETALTATLKLIAQPVIAFAVGAFILHLTHPQLFAVVVCASLPTGQNAYIFAQRYGVGEALASRAVLVTTTLSLVSLAGAAALFGHA